jgi:N-acetylglucosamine-6-phosphate deacetylase
VSAASQLDNRIVSLYLSGIDLATGDPVRVVVTGGRIDRVEPLYREPERRRADERLPFIAPGLVDLQINGYGGIDFNADELTAEDVEAAAGLILRQGVTTFFPTIITNSAENIERLCAVIADACDRYPLAGEMIAGIHLEGPFISREDGPRGAHPLRHVRKPDWNLFRRWQEAACGRIRLVTLSPEWEGAARFIGQCREAGVTVSIGHTAATSGQIADAVKAGATLSTHLGNGAHLMLPRHPNYLWDQLAEPRLSVTVIGDGFHLPDAVLRVFMTVKKDRLALVSDAVSLAGMPPGRYRVKIGGDVVLTESGRLHMSDNPGFLAGSAIMLKDAVAGIVGRRLADLPSAWELASVAPARLMGLRHLQGGVAPGSAADLVLFSAENGHLSIHSVIKNGSLRVHRQEGTNGD